MHNWGPNTNSQLKKFYVWNTRVKDLVLLSGIQITIDTTHTSVTYQLLLRLMVTLLSDTNISRSYVVRGNITLQGSQRRHSSLPSFAADPSPSDTPYNYGSAQQPTAAPAVFQPAAAAAAAAPSTATATPSDVSNGRQGAVFSEELDLEPPSARCRS